MPKKKDYQSLRVGKTTSDGSQQSPSASLNAGLTVQGPRSADDADIDLVKLLGSKVRIPRSNRTIVLSRALGRGVDGWVFASADAFRKQLLAGVKTATCLNNQSSILVFFDYLTEGATSAGLARSRPDTPADLSPVHIEQFIAWLKKKGAAEGWAESSVRGYYQGVKATLLVMFSLGLIQGESHRFFKRKAFKRDDGSSTTSLSEAEQEFLAAAIKADLSAIHHGRLEVTMRELQALRLLLVAHRMGRNTMPLLELSRDAMKPGLLPGTVHIQTVKHRGKRVNTQMGLDGSNAIVDQAYLPFSLAEGAVIGQAIASTEHLVVRAPKRIQNRVWLYEVSKNLGPSIRKGDVSALEPNTLCTSIKALVNRHKLTGDDGKPLVVNMSRLRKSWFDRAFRIADGDLVLTANLMGNTPQVSGANYPSMNSALQAEAAGFMNEDYIGMIRGSSDSPSGHKKMHIREIKPVDEVQTLTPVSGCADSLGGEYAPKNGNSCDRFVMCLFCSSFAIVGTVDELWRLFSFQAFARVELTYLEDRLGPVPEGDERFEDLQELRDRYRLAIPYIDSFTQEQFAPSRVAQARAKTAAGLHPFWTVQLERSRRARSADVGVSNVQNANGTSQGMHDAGNRGMNGKGDGAHGT